MVDSKICAPSVVEDGTQFSVELQLEIEGIELLEVSFQGGTFCVGQAAL